MIRRGQHHVLYDDVELMQRVMQPQAIRVLRQAMWLYEVHAMRELHEQENMVSAPHVAQHEFDMYRELLKETRKLLRLPVDIDFSRKNMSRRNPPGRKRANKSR